MNRPLRDSAPHYASGYPEEEDEHYDQMRFGMQAPPVLPKVI
jgi:hypothetical protein